MAVRRQPWKLGLRWSCGLAWSTSDSVRFSDAQGRAQGLAGVRASTRGRFAPGGANGGTTELGWRCAQAKERLGTGIYRRWRSDRRSWGQPRRLCTRGVGIKAQRRAADQRPNGERRLAPGTVQAPTNIMHSSSPSRSMDRWVLWCLGVRAQSAYGGLAWHARDVAWEGALASRRENCQGVRPGRSARGLPKRL
jgi:hypothetical protein